VRRLKMVFRVQSPLELFLFASRYLLRAAVSNISLLCSTKIRLINLLDDETMNCRCLISKPYCLRNVFLFLFFTSPARGMYDKDFFLNSTTIRRSATKIISQPLFTSIKELFFLRGVVV
jgi:hypothetical protein